MQKNFSIRSISSRKIYSVDEAAEVIGANSRTIRNWIKFEGLPVLLNDKPRGILGRQLKDFIVARRESKKRNPSAFEFFCFHCKKPTGPKENRVVQVQGLTSSIRMAAVCNICGHKINRAINTHDLPKWLAEFDVQKDEL